MKADDLWEKYEPVFGLINKSNFYAALTEYGNSVKAEAVKVCQSKGHYLAAELVEKMEIK